MEFANTPALASMFAQMVAIWPEHHGYLERSLAARDQEALAFTEELAVLIERLAANAPGGLAALLLDYRYLCEHITLPEELNFRRTGGYRLTRFADAVRDVYSRSDYMKRYMNGLLVSNVFWSNHAHAMNWFVRQVLPLLPHGANHLEIGPGHGVYLYWAARQPGMGRVVGWDVSAQSIANTRNALSKLGVDHPVELVQRDLFDAVADDEAVFDSIVMSEILEHLEDPTAALVAARRALRPGGLLWINVPANSPAPDHIFLVTSPEHACDLARDAGLEILQHAAFPMSGQTLEKARKNKLAISCLVLCRKPNPT